MLLKILMKVGEALYFILPAYVANATPVVLGGGMPLDFGKKFVNGKPILGSRKTIRGFVLGVLIGTLIGFLQGRIYVGFMQSLGAMLGDLSGSFVKRRFGKKPGSPFPILDQMDFLFGALLLSSLICQVDLIFIFILLILTPIIHLATNWAAFKLGLKSEPW